MRVQISRVQKGERTLAVSLLVTTRGKPPFTVKVEVEPPVKYVRSLSGWLKDEQGKWHQPFRMVNGEWQFYLDPRIKWATQDPSDEDLIALTRSHVRGLLHQEVVDTCMQEGFSTYTDDEAQVRVVPKGPVHIDPVTGMVQVEIEAFDSETSEPLWVHDGFWAFDYPPVMVDGVENPPAALKKVLASQVRRNQP